MDRETKERVEVASTTELDIRVGLGELLRSERFNRNVYEESHREHRLEQASIDRKRESRLRTLEAIPDEIIELFTEPPALETEGQFAAEARAKRLAEIIDDVSHSRISIVDTEEATVVATGPNAVNQRFVNPPVTMITNALARPGKYDLTTHDSGYWAIRARKQA